MYRFLNILELAIDFIRKQKFKYFSLILIYAVIVAFFASIIFFTSSLKYETGKVFENTADIWVQQLQGGRIQTMPQAFKDTLKTIRGIKQVTSRTWGYYFDSPTGAVFSVYGIDSLNFGQTPLRSGPVSFPDTNSVITGIGYLDSHFLEAGQMIALIDARGKLKEFTITEKFDSDSDLLTHDLIILNSFSARKILGIPRHHVSDFAVFINNPDEISTIATKIDRMKPGLRVITSKQLQSTYETVFGYRGGLFIFGAMISILAFLVFAWDRASGLSSSERREIGILKGIGWQIPDVLMLKSFESIIIAATATGFGMILAYIHVFMIGAPLLKPFLTGWSVIYPDFKPVVYVDLQGFLLIIVLSVIPYLAATVIPAWKASVTDPAEVMQNG